MSGPVPSAGAVEPGRSPPWIPALLLLFLVLPGGTRWRANPCRDALADLPAVQYFAGQTWRHPDGLEFRVDIGAARVEAGELSGSLDRHLLEGWAWFHWLADGRWHELRIQCRPVDGHIVARDWASASIDGGPMLWWRRVAPEPGTGP
jgi:hypothetical protein